MSTNCEQNHKTLTIRGGEGGEPDHKIPVFFYGFPNSSYLLVSTHGCIVTLVMFLQFTLRVTCATVPHKKLG